MLFSQDTTRALWRYLMYISQEDLDLRFFLFEVSKKIQITFRIWQFLGYTDYIWNTIQIYGLLIILYKYCIFI